jgi:hypothetical protein
MILELHDSLFIKNKDDGLDENEFCQISFILRLRRFGKAFVSASMKSLDRFKESGLGKHDKSVIDTIMSDQTKWRHWLNEQDFRVVITCLESSKNFELSNSTGFPHINILEVNFEAPTLICENLTDAGIFKGFLELYIKNKLSLKGVDLYIDFVPGGGSTTCQVLEHHQKTSNSPSLCIVDSDRASPSCEIGNTAKKVMEIDEHPMTKRYLINAREAENLLPLEFLTLFACQSSLNTKLDKLIPLYNLRINDVAPYVYFDVKKGLVKADLQEQLASSIFWKEVANRLGLNVEACNCQSRKHCNCILIDGLGSNLLKEVLLKLQNSDDCKEYNFFNTLSLLGGEIESICKKILPFAAVPQRMFT